MLRYDSAREQYRNSVVAVNGTLTWYDKRRLVPFGEFFPVPDCGAQLDAPHEPAVRRHDPGDPDQPPLGAAGEKLGATICYEDAYGSQQLAVLRRRRCS